MPTVPSPEFAFDSRSRYALLSQTERDVLDLALEGKPNKAISREIGLSLRTVERHRAGALRKLGVQTIVEAVALREAVVASSEDLLLAAFRGSAHGMNLVTPDMRFAAVNGTFCRLLGYRETELIGKPFSTITHPDDYAINLLNAERLFSGAITEFCIRKRYLRQSGDSVAAELSVTVAYGSDGQPRFGFSRISAAV